MSNPADLTPSAPPTGLTGGLRLGRHLLPNRVFAAPMAGVTDRPYRRLARQLGAGYCVSEMVTSRADLRYTLKTSRRANHDGEAAPIAVQIVGTDPEQIAEATHYNLERGADIIDINMGCPAKKVCNRWAGSALMQDEDLAARLVEAAVAAARPFDAPVTLKMRAGWCEAARNAPRIARRAEAAGAAMLVVHGRTREQGYGGEAEYATLAEVKRSVGIPVVANGDIDSPQKAAAVLRQSGADAVMIGRAAMGRPWLFAHLDDHYALYGEAIGVRTARKHVGWYVAALPEGETFRRHFNTLGSAAEQLAALRGFLDSGSKAAPLAA
ncbi:MAG TPA: tRNA dihydrouridine synthase DusB [Thiomonas arsenitoxydans]|uniref:tRNA dihydrouridine synthase DusB n=1 Tax=Thiomonas TaxID=32012 RepID=UPI00257D87F3|nr:MULTISPECIES: tRNA dihydrouridine synthase DusB [Thiomonas]HML80218.1 tRNA dihydrouridine synthase DusB [Thiomonas arsenitoxydans]